MAQESSRPSPDTLRLPRPAVFLRVARFFSDVSGVTLTDYAIIAAALLLIAIGVVPDLRNLAGNLLNALAGPS